MVTVALLAMSGLIGMAVDFGWSFFMRRSAQSAADAAALAAVNAAMAQYANGTTLACGSAISCTATDCSNGGTANLISACDYASQNGFSAGGDNGRQSITVTAGVNSPAAPPPTAPNVNVHYWVTVQVKEAIPQLYSAVLGNATSTIAARATAAIVDSFVDASLIGLGRSGDTQPTWQAGNSPGIFNPDLLVGNNSNVTGKLGIILASNDPGAGDLLGSAIALSPYATTRGNLTPSTSWYATAQTGQPDGPQFYDPFRGLGQPPVAGSALTPYPVPNGNLNAACGTACPSGYYYYAVDSNNNPTGGALTVSSSLTFSSTSFGDFVFYGGLNICPATACSSVATVNFAAGRYVMAGVSNPLTTSDFYIGSGAQVSGGTSNQAGSLFIVTDPNYPGLSSVAPPPIFPSQLSFGQTTIIPGSTGTLNMFGLSSAQTLPTNTNAQGSSLSDFGPVILWQDQRFSNVQYSATGNIACGDSSDTCVNPSAPSTSPEMVIGPALNMRMDGVVYQPRGAWLQVQPSTNLQGPVMLISGAIDVGQNARIPGASAGQTQRTLWTRMVALVE